MTGDNKGEQQATPGHVVAIKTSNYYSDWNNPNAISIAKYDGRRYSGKYKGPHYKDLAPNDDIWDKYKHDPDYNSERYTADFLKQLAALDPLKVYQDLCALRPGCTEIVLLCFEPPGEFCHRRLVAEWLGEALGMKIDEISETKPQEG